MLNMARYGFAFATKWKRRELTRVESPRVKKRSSMRWMWLALRLLQFALDLTALIVAFALVYLCRFDFVIPEREFNYALIRLPYVVLIQFASLIISGVYMFIWRYTGMAELKAFLKAACWSTGLLLLMRLGLPDKFAIWRTPISVIMADIPLAFGAVLGLRVLSRAVYERGRSRHRG